MLRQAALRLMTVGLIAIALVGCLLVGCMQTPEQKYQGLVAQGQDLFQQQQYKKALASWLEASAIKRDDWRLLADIGTCYQKAADFSAAARWYSEALKVDAKAVPVWLELAKILMVRGDLEDARAALDEASALAPENALLLRLEGDVRLLERRVSEAEAFYRRSLTADSTDPIALIRLAACLAAGSDRLGALRLIAGVPSASLDEPEVLINLAQFWRLCEDESQAEKYFLAAVQLRPNDLSLIRQLAEYYFQTANWDRCETYLGQLAAADPDDPAVAKLRLELLLARGQIEEAETLIIRLKQGQAPDLELQLLEGKTQILANRPTAAIGALEAAVKNEPNLAIAHYLLGLAYFQGGHLKLGQRSLMQALSLRKHYSNAELVLAASFYKEGDYPIAAQYLARTCEREPENIQAQALLAAVLYAQGERGKAWERLALVRKFAPQSLLPVLFELTGAEVTTAPVDALRENERLVADLLARYPESVDVLTRIEHLALDRPALTELLQEHLRQAVRRRTEDPFAAQLLGQLELAQDRKERAQGLFTRAVTLEPLLVSGYRNLLDLAADNPSVRTTILERWIKNAPQLSEPYIHLAQIWIEQGKSKEALAILEEALKYQPESGLLANNLAWLLLQTGGDLKRVLALAQAAFAKLPEDPAVMDTLALAYFKNNLASRSLWLLSEAIRNKPGDPLLHYHLGMVYQAQGDQDLARTTLQRSLNLGLSMPERLEAEHLLAQLSPAVPTTEWAPPTAASDDFKELPKSPLQW